MRAFNLPSFASHAGYLNKYEARMMKNPRSG
jgi:hypothetical protein